MARNDHDWQIVCLALGRIFRLGSRPTQPGDIEEYERCRTIIMDRVGARPDKYPNFARDYPLYVKNGFLGD